MGHRKLICIAFVIFLTGCEMTPRDPYKRAITKKRYSKDSLFKYDFAASPFATDKETLRDFWSLSYFAVDPEYKTTATWMPNPSPTMVMLADKMGRTQNYIDAGQLAFTLQGRACTLTAFRSADPEMLMDPEAKHHLFIPFFDQTNGKETYEKGRYLDAQLSEDKSQIELDFNLAYNPYCAYAESWSCPVPPNKNRLPLAVEAGEKTYSAPSL